jgi:hypothetical protein
MDRQIHYGDAGDAKSISFLVTTSIGRAGDRLRLYFFQRDRIGDAGHLRAGLKGALRLDPRFLSVLRRMVFAS